MTPRTRELLIELRELFCQQLQTHRIRELIIRIDAALAESEQAGAGDCTTPDGLAGVRANTPNQPEPAPAVLSTGSKYRRTQQIIRQLRKLGIDPKVYDLVRPFSKHKD